MSNNLKKVLVVGAGVIAAEYCKVLHAMGIEPDVVGRNEDKAKKFGEEHSVTAIGGGIDAYLSTNDKKYDYAIVATDILNLCANTCSLLEYGIKKIFTEKPAGMNKAEIEQICSYAEKNDAKVYVAYNRRFYASTAKALEVIHEDGGIKSFNFEFTEWSHVIEPLPTPADVKEEWFLANSTHVVDLAFFLGGEPEKMASFITGELNWHKSGCVYAGAGVTRDKALFSYQANWAAPGRWAIEILTSKHRLYFKPMEQLSIQELGAVAVNPIEIDDKLDLEYKPGFYKEVESFINEIDDGKKKTIQDQLRYMDYFEKIEGK
ncbi:Gfo/Idh/MocA family protein [Selenomonas sp. FC4001]|uniref:Gfo/Idh/MocA family protein n=1 Tax=Selenomonas sp. FC4001 TaxID=1408313 RepID=UPI00055C7E66|nr:Gfo/Idh/MocA family oxidoreductase [Selenomonas sp. FC4001]